LLSSFVTHFNNNNKGALPFTLKKYLKAKEEFMETQIFHPAKIYLIFKKSSKRNQNPS
jgi:hypothetical protein